MQLESKDSLQDFIAHSDDELDAQFSDSPAHRSQRQAFKSGPLKRESALSDASQDEENHSHASS